MDSLLVLNLTKTRHACFLPTPENKVAEQSRLVFTYSSFFTKTVDSIPQFIQPLLSYNPAPLLRQ
jgi:hypothetical protein